MKAKFIISLLALTLITALPTSGSVVPYPSYIYNFHGKAVPAPQAFTPSTVITGYSLGVNNFKEPQDIAICASGVYILDSGNNRIVHLDSEWNFIDLISEFENNGSTDKFKNPQGIFVTEGGVIYVADTDNARIVVLESDGSFVKTISVSKEDFEGVFVDSFNFRPIKVATTSLEKVYVISKNTFDGIMEFDQDGKFRGFIGAPRVTPSVADIFWSMIATDEQRQRMALFLPVEYNFVTVDEQGYIFATEGNTMRLLNPSGLDISRALGFWDPIGDINNVEEKSAFVGVTPGPWGDYSVLDRSRGRIFTYDRNGNLLYVFGGLGSQKGLNQSPSAIAMQGNNMVILDSRLGQITIYNPTEYTLLIQDAINAYNLGKYELAEDYWRQVLKLNANYDLAYSGIGRAQLLAGDYQNAMQSYRLGNDRLGYSRAYERYRLAKVTDNFEAIATMFTIICIAIFIIAKLGWFKKLKQRLIHLKQRLTPPEIAVCNGDLHKLDNTSQRKLSVASWLIGSGLCYSLHIIFHPFDGFWDLKHERHGNIGAAVILTGLISWTYVFMCQQTGFLFNYRDLTAQNIYMDIASVVVPLLLWAVVNWALTTLMDGKGTLRDIFIVTTFAFAPFILINIPATTISNYLTLEEGAFLYFARVISLIWSLILLFFGTMVVHEYELGKGVLVSVLTIVGIASTLFLSLLFFSVVDQVWAFIIIVYRELFVRI